MLGGLGGLTSPGTFRPSSTIVPGDPTLASLGALVCTALWPLPATLTRDLNGCLAFRLHGSPPPRSAHHPDPAAILSGRLSATSCEGL